MWRLRLESLHGREMPSTFVDRRRFGPGIQQTGDQDFLPSGLFGSDKFQIAVSANGSTFLDRHGPDAPTFIASPARAGMDPLHEESVTRA